MISIFARIFLIEGVASRLAGWASETQKSIVTKDSNPKFLTVAEWWPQLALRADSCNPRHIFSCSLDQKACFGGLNGTFLVGKNRLRSTFFKAILLSFLSLYPCINTANVDL